MKLSPKEKLTIQRETSSIRKQLTEGGLKAKEKIALQRQWKANIARLGSNKKLSVVATSESDIDLVARFVSGAFNSLSLSQFLEMIDDVESKGATLDQIKEGSKLWASANIQAA